MKCPHRPPCGACPRFGETGISPDGGRVLDSLALDHGLPKVQVLSGKLTEYRLRARLAIRGRSGVPKLGLFETGTHRVAHIPHCRVHHPLINRVADVVRRALIDARITCYSDKAHLGIARYVQVVVERSSQSAQVVIVANTSSPEALQECFQVIQARLGVELHSLWFNSNLTHANVILGADFTNWCGPDSVSERFGGAEIHYPPGAFGQNNLDIAQAIIDHVREQIPEGARVTEYYAGVGAVGLSVLARCAHLRLNEINPHSILGLSLGIDRLNGADRSKIMVVPGVAGDARWAADGAQVVIADPPRKGLDMRLADHLAENPPERFLYISCGLESLCGDVVRLTSRGKLRLAGISAFNLLPFTDHIESVSRFERI